MDDMDDMDEQNNEREQKHYAWQDGLPTGPDVTLILKRWPNLAVGQRIKYSEIASLLGIKVGTSRWRTVTNAWRKRELDDGRVIKCVPGHEFIVANAEQIIDDTHVTLKHITRSARRQRIHLSTIKEVDGQTKAIVDHQARLMHAVELDAKAKRQIAIPSTVVPMRPQIKVDVGNDKMESGNG